MKKVKWKLLNRSLYDRITSGDGFCVGCGGGFYVDDNCTLEEIEKMVRDEILNIGISDANFFDYIFETEDF